MPYKAHEPNNSLYQRASFVLAPCEQKTASGDSSPLTSLAQARARTFDPQHVGQNHSAAHFPWNKHRNVTKHQALYKPELKMGPAPLCPSQSSLISTTL